MNDEEILKEEFSKLIPKLEQWQKMVAEFIHDDLKKMEEQLKIKIPPSFRIKSLDSFIGKALYRDKSYKSPILDIEDKVGGRVVFLVSRDVEEAYKLLKTNPNWDCKTTRNIKNEVQEQPNHFDYQSIHIVVSPSDILKEFSESEKKYLTCEIQLRTLLQHAYAEMSHDNVYKGPFKNDKSISRHLAKSMALMEAADDYFCRIFELMIDKERSHNVYFEHLLHLFKSEIPYFQEDSIDWVFTEDVFALLSKKDIPIDEIDSYWGNNKELLIPILKLNNHIVRQPAFILLSYYLKLHPSWTMENIEIPPNTLKTATRSLGISLD